KSEVCSQPAELLSIYPTLLELCGLPPNPQLDGKSLVPLLTDPDAAWNRPAITTHGTGNHAVRTATHRYIRYHDGSEELYDLRVDANEWTNLAADPAFADLKKELARWLPDKEQKAFPPAVKSAR
ncbi:MAG TPA: sulfatase/phosphatase domain-containing protein, partial [Luteolibacter sp.]|nr:sulfatase/phosphatase domain-containing protein [Luteolibacter sp.]